VTLWWSDMPSDQYPCAVCVCVCVCMSKSEGCSWHRSVCHLTS